MAFAALATQEDVEIADLVALGGAVDSLIATATATNAQLAQFVADAALAPEAAAKLQAIIDSTNASLAKVQAALPAAPPAPVA